MNAIKTPGQPSSFFRKYWLSAQIARRYYSTGIQNRYVRFINRASRVGFAIGVAALIVGLSLMNGFEKELRKSLLSAIPHIEFESVTGHLEDWHKTANQVLDSNSVAGVGPYIKLNAMIQKQQIMEAVLLKAVDADLEQTVNIIPAKITDGNWLTGQPQEAVIGAGLATKLHLSLGDNLELLVPGFSPTGRLTAPDYLQFTVVGIYRVGGQVDTGQIFSNLTDIVTSQGLADSEAKGVAVSLHDPFKARTAAGAIGQSLTDYVYVLDWFRSQGHVYNDIVLVKDIMYLVMVLVIAVASFNIVSSLAMSVQEKYGDIGILMTMGLNKRSVLRVFIIMGMLTALRGIAWGVLIGCLIAWKLPEIFNAIEQALDFKALDGDVYFIDYLPSVLDISQVAVISITAIVIAFLASLYPATKASRLQPVELLN